MDNRADLLGDLDGYSSDFEDKEENVTSTSAENSKSKKLLRKDQPSTSQRYEPCKHVAIAFCITFKRIEIYK